MSQEELVGAYLDGRISRRTLIRRLLGAGVSMGAAVAYAHVLKPERAFARPDRDHYPDTTVRIVDEPLGKVVNKNRLYVRVKLDEDSELRPLRLYAYRMQGGEAVDFLGDRALEIDGPDVRKVKIPLSQAGVGALDGRSRARIRVFWRGEDKQGKLPSGEDFATLSA